MTLAADSGRDPSALRIALAPVAIGFVIYALVSVCLRVPGLHGAVTPVWLANAFALSALLCSDTRRWPALAAFAFGGNVLANLGSGDSFQSALTLSAVNLFEYLGAAAALRRWIGRDIDLTRPRDLVAFLAVAGFAAPLACAGLAALALQMLRGAAVLPSLAMWALGDSLGLIILTPCLLILGRADALIRAQPFTAKALGALAALAAATVAVFSQQSYPLLFLVPPVLLLVVLELDLLGAVLGVLLIAAVAVGFTLAGRGPILLLRGGVADQAFVLQAFLAACVMLGLPAAALLGQKRRLRQSLAAALDEVGEQARRAAMAERVARVGYWRLDLGAGKISWSSQMYRMFGLPETGEPDLTAAMAMVHPDDRALAQERLDKVITGAIGWADSFTRILRPGGDICYASGRAVPEHGPGGEVVAVFGTMADITERTCAEAALAESEARFRMLAESARDIVLQTDVDGRVVYASPSAKTVIGYAPAEMVGRQWHDFMHPEDGAKIRELGAARLRDPGRHRPRAVDYRILHKDGGYVWIEGRPSLVLEPHTGAVLAVTDVCRDVSERKALEAELRLARDEAETAALAKAEFLANMSHELRTPLTAVLGFSRLLEELPDLRPDGRRYVERVSSAGRALLATVNDILDFSKLEAGQVDLKLAATSPEAVAREALEIFGEQAAVKGLELGLVGIERLPEFVQTDPDRLRQILLNLIGNAVKFTDEGFVRVEADYDPIRRRLAFAVVDSGPGVAPAQQERLFQRFSQVDASNTRRHGGTGLGLAICRGLAEAMGGGIGLESREGSGSRFWFHVRAETAAAAQSRRSDGAAPALPDGCRVLVADDNRVNRELVRAILGPFGAAVQDACDGREAVEVASAAPFDVILMDIRMPNLNGAQALAEIRAGSGPNRTTPILAFTADAGSPGAPDFESEGFDAVVGKPLTAIGLIGAMAACVGGQGGTPARKGRKNNVA